MKALGYPKSWWASWLDEILAKFKQWEKQLHDIIYELYKNIPDQWNKIIVISLTYIKENL
jgi:hypothetical protein